jgi:hypothetical protein
MATRGKRRVRASVSKGKTNGTGDDDERAARVLKDLKAMGGLLVRSSVTLLNGDAADQFVWLGRQIQTRAEQGMSALAAPPLPKPPRSATGRR